MDQDALKQQAALAALEMIQAGMIIGVGSGSTIKFFIDALSKVKNKIDAAVVSSKKTEEQMKALGIPIIDLNSVGDLPLYIDSADEINAAKQMIKGGGGALTREKIIASAAKKFVCIADQSKMVDLLGQFPVAVEVIPMARSFVARQVVQYGGDPEYRQGFITDNQNNILDVHNLKILHPLEVESKFNNIPGVVANGIFAARPADVVLLATHQGLKTF